MPGLKGVRKFWWITFFLAPSLLGLTLFTLLPIVASAGLTVFEWDLLTPPRFVGLENFVNLASDQNFRQAFWHTLQYIIGYIPTVMVLALAVALMLKQTSRWSVLLRIGFFMPVVSAWVAVALIWKWLLNPRVGLFNYLLSLLGIVGPNWLFDPKWAMPAIIEMSCASTAACMRAMAIWNPSASRSTVVMSRNWMPGLGKSGIVRISARSGSVLIGSARNRRRRTMRGTRG